MKKVLFITYYWPPAGGGGIQRITRFCKYLNRYGWMPIVLTVRNGDYMTTDESLKHDVVNIDHVYLARPLEPHILYKQFSRLIAWFKNPLRKKAPQSKKIKPQAMSLNKKIGEYIRLNLFIPDSRIGWRKDACKIGTQIIEKEQPELIFSSAPPYTTHLIAQRLSKKMKIPWVADFRDPWLENHAYNTVPRLRLVKSINQKLEAQVLQTANHITCANRRLKQLLVSKLPRDQASKCHVITNGYDRDDIKDVEPSSDRFPISYYGTIYPNGFPIHLLEAIQEYAEEDKTFSGDVLFNVVGNISPNTQVLLTQMIPAQNLNIQPYVGHEKLLEYLYQPQILVVVINNFQLNEATVPGKIYEYLPTGNPILGLGPVPGDTADILEKTGTGTMYTHHDKEGIKRFIRQSYDLWKAKKIQQTTRRFPEFEQRALMEKLAKLFNQLCKEP
ncbi:MAG: glycosyltransferase [Kiritimatiellae bacterium]|nr:glycosyltransferase [Kiritimatiellia bacterium]